MRICNTYCLSKAILVTRTRLIFALYVRCLPCGVFYIQMVYDKSNLYAMSYKSWTTIDVMYFKLLSKSSFPELREATRNIRVIHKLITWYLLISVKVNNERVQTHMRTKAGIYAIGSTGCHIATLCISKFVVQNISKTRL
jgi:hypothetical protein